MEDKQISHIEIEIGKRITELREENRESQTQLAEEMKVSRPIIQHWESGTRHIKADHILALARHFGVSADYLLGNTTDRTIDMDPNLKAVNNYLGLSEKAIWYLLQLKWNQDNTTYDKRLKILSSMLEKYTFDRMLANCCRYIRLKSIDPSLHYQTTADYTAMKEALEKQGFVISLPESQARDLFAEEIATFLRVLLDEIARPQEIHIVLPENAVDELKETASDAANIESGESDQDH